jgi:type II secretory pathway pseudopilin PulG
VARTRDEEGILMLELLMAMVVMSIALTALVMVFTTGLFTMRKATQTTTATFLADAQMETFRAMTSRDIGIDLGAGTVAALDSNYKNDAACANGAVNCAANGVAATETGPTGAAPHTCTVINGWYPNTQPCTPSRTINATSTPVASPDGRSYRIDTYVVQLAAVVASGSVPAERSRKQVTVVVRDSTQLGSALARETSIFDCSTGATPASADC